MLTKEDTKTRKKHTNFIQLVLWNIEGAKAINNKIGIDCIEGDIVVLTETFLTEPMGKKHYHGYHSLATQGIAGRPSGGITIYIKPHLTPTRIVHKTTNVIMVSTSVATILAAYFQPEVTSPDIIDSINEALQKANHSDAIIIAGDLNCRIDKSNPKTKRVLEYLEQEGFKVTNNPAETTYVTQNGTSTIDLILINNKTTLIKQKVETTNPIRKHLPIKTTLKLNGKTTNQENDGKVIVTRKIDEAVIEREQLTIKGCDTMIAEGHINEATNRIEYLLHKTIIAKPKNQRRAKVWFDADCYKQRKEVIKDLHAAKSTNKQEELTRYNNSRKRYKTLLENKKKMYMETEARKIAEAVQENPFQACRPRQPISTQEIKMETWTNHFSKVLQNKDSRPEMGNPTAHITEQIITSKEVAEALARAKNNKAAGPDQIFYEHLKATQPWLLQTWTALFNAFVKLQRIPESWKRSTLKVLYKGKGDTSKPRHSLRKYSFQNIYLHSYKEDIRTYRPPTTRRTIWFPQGQKHFTGSQKPDGRHHGSQKRKRRETVHSVR